MTQNDTTAKRITRDAFNLAEQLLACVGVVAVAAVTLGIVTDRVTIRTFSSDGGAVVTLGVRYF